MIVTALSVVFYNYILIYFAGLGLFGLNFLLYTLSYIDANSVLKWLEKERGIFWVSPVLKEK